MTWFCTVPREDRLLRRGDVAERFPGRVLYMRGGKAFGVCVQHRGYCIYWLIVLWCALVFKIFQSTEYANLLVKLNRKLHNFNPTRPYTVISLHHSPSLHLTPSLPLTTTTMPPTHNPAHLPLLSSIQPLNLSPSLTLNPTLNALGSVVRLVGIALQSNASSMGRSSSFWLSTIRKATKRRMNAV